MALPLQPELSPWPPAQRRLALLLALVLAVLAVGCLAPVRPRPSQPVRLLLSGPGHEGEYARVVVQMARQATTRLWCVWYVVRPDGGPVDDLLAALADAARRGIDVRVLLDQGTGPDGQNDKHLAAVERMRSLGIRVVLDEEGRTSHAKVVVADSRWSVVGSHNLTRAALTGNREASLVVDDPGLAVQLELWLSQVPGWAR